MRSAEFCLNTTCLSCLTIGNKFFLVLIFPPTANSGIFNNCTCCAPKKRQKDMDPEASRASKRERTNAEWEGKWSRLLEVQGDDEDDNCSSSSSSTTAATSQQPRQRQDDEARLQVQPASQEPLRLRGHSPMEEHPLLAKRMPRRSRRSSASFDFSLAR